MLLGGGRGEVYQPDSLDLDMLFSGTVHDVLERVMYAPLDVLYRARTSLTLACKTTASAFKATDASDTT
jgi:hypothetical protein